MSSLHPDLPDVAASLRAAKAERQGRLPFEWAAMVGVWWLLRLAGWWARGAERDAWAAVGAGEDVVLVSGAAAAMVLLKGRAIARIVGFSAAIAGFLRVADVLNCYIEHAHITEISWWHVHPAAWRLFLESGALAAMGLGLGVAWFAWRMMWRLSRRREPLLGTRPWSRGGAVAVAMGLGVIAWQLLAPVHSMHMALVPEINAVRTFVDFRMARAAPPSTTNLPADCFGILPRAPAPSTGTIPQFKASKPPKHLVMIAVESLSDTLVDAMSVHEAEFAALVASGMRVRGYHGQARPTHFGLIANFCGLLPGTRPFDARIERKIPPHPCVPRVLQTALGMTTAFVHGGFSSYTGLDTTLRALGFASVDGYDQILPSRGGYVTGAETIPFGVPDRAVYAHALRRLNAADRAGGRAFIAISTLDSHYPGYPTTKARPGQRAADATTQDAKPPTRLARGVISAKAALAQFVIGLRVAGLLDDTLIVITADHAMTPVNEYVALAPGKIPHFFEPLALVFVHPNFTPSVVDSHSGQLDLAPTIIDAMGLKPDVARTGGRSLLRTYATARSRLPALSGSRFAWTAPHLETPTPLANFRGQCPGTRSCDVWRCVQHLDGYWYGANPLQQ